MIRNKGSCPRLCHFHRADLMIGGIECGLEGQGHPSHLCHQTPGSSQVPGERRSASLPQSPRPSPFLCTSFSVQGLEGYPDKRPIQLLQRDIHGPSLLADHTFRKEQQRDASALWTWPLGRSGPEATPPACGVFWLLHTPYTHNPGSLLPSVFVPPQWFQPSSLCGRFCSDTCEGLDLGASAWASEGKDAVQSQEISNWTRNRVGLTAHLLRNLIYTA